MFITDDGFELPKCGKWFTVTHNCENKNSIPAKNVIIGNNINNHKFANLFHKEENAIKFMELLQSNSE